MALILCLDSEDPAVDQNMKLVGGERWFENKSINQEVQWMTLERSARTNRKSRHGFIWYWKLGMSCYNTKRHNQQHCFKKVSLAYGKILVDCCIYFYYIYNLKKTMVVLMIPRGIATTYKNHSRKVNIFFYVCWNHSSPESEGGSWNRLFKIQLSKLGL